MCEVSIAANPTVSDPHHPHADDAQASLRIDLVGQLAAAQLAVESTIADLLRSSADSGAVNALRSQLTGLIGLRQSIGTASGRTLGQLSTLVAATADAAMASAQQAQAAANTGANSPTMLAQRAHQALTEVGDKIFADKVLDPYLQFSSPEDEAAYRKREKERSEAYEQEMAKHTAEGDRRALEIAKAQIADAKAHGADRSPDMPSIDQKLEEATTGLLASSDRSAEAKGGTDRPIGKPRAPEANADLDNVLATLKSAGIRTDELASNTNEGHGLSKGPIRSGNATNLPG